LAKELRDAGGLRAGTRAGGLESVALGAGLFILGDRTGNGFAMLLGRVLAGTETPGDIVLVLLLQVLPAVLILRGARIYRYHQRLGAPDAADAMRRDSRPPILYLRSFRHDERDEARSLLARLRLLFNPLLSMSVSSHEQRLAALMSRAGPFVAVGDPRDPAPPLGAARLYVEQGQWQERVQALLAGARLVVVRAGLTPGLRWEVETLLQTLPLSKVFLFLPRDGDREFLAHARGGLFLAWAQRWIRTPVPERLLRKPYLTFSEEGRAMAGHRLKPLLLANGIPLARAPRALDGLEQTKVGLAWLLALWAAVTAKTIWALPIGGLLGTGLVLAGAWGWLPRGVLLGRTAGKSVTLVAGSMALAGTLAFAAVAQGFRTEFETVVRESVPDLTVHVHAGAASSSFEETARALEAVPGVAATAPRYETTAVYAGRARATTVPAVHPVVVLGVDWGREQGVTSRRLDTALNRDDPFHGDDPRPGALVSRAFARRHEGAGLGEPLEAPVELVFASELEPRGKRSLRSQEVVIRGVYSGAPLSREEILVDCGSFAGLAGVDVSAAVVVRLDRARRAEEVADAIREALPHADVVVGSPEHVRLSQAATSELAVLRVLLTLTMAGAALTVTLVFGGGFGPAVRVAVFGSGLGYLLTANFNAVRAFMAERFGWNLFPPEVSLLDNVPTDWRWSQAATVSILCGILIWAGEWLPVWTGYRAMRKEIYPLGAP